MSYRNDLDALGARHDALAEEVAVKTRELDALGQMLDEAKARARLPVLPNIRVASPCTADWDKMTGDERVRACDACNKNVYNLSNMTRDEAEALLLEREGRLCVRYYQRKDGTILLKDCSVGVSQRRKRRLFAAGAAALLAGGGALAYKLTRPEPEPAPAPEVVEVVQGGIAEPFDPGELEAPPHVAAPEELEVMMGDVAFDDTQELANDETDAEGGSFGNGNVE